MNFRFCSVTGLRWRTIRRSGRPKTEVLSRQNLVSIEYKSLKKSIIDINGLEYWLEYTNSIKCYPKIDSKIEAFWVIDKFFVESTIRIPDDIYRQRLYWCCHAYWFKLQIPIDIVRNFLTTYPQVLFKSREPAFPFQWFPHTPILTIWNNWIAFRILNSYFVDLEMLLYTETTLSSSKNQTR